MFTNYCPKYTFLISEQSYEALEKRNKGLEKEIEGLKLDNKSLTEELRQAHMKNRNLEREIKDMKKERDLQVNLKLHETKRQSKKYTTYGSISFFFGGAVGSLFGAGVGAFVMGVLMVKKYSLMSVDDVKAMFMRNEDVRVPSKDQE